MQVSKFNIEGKKIAFITIGRKESSKADPNNQVRLKRLKNIPLGFYDEISKIKRFILMHLSNDASDAEYIV